MGTTITPSGYGRAHNYAQNIHKSFFLFSLFLVIKKRTARFHNQAAPNLNNQ